MLLWVWYVRVGGAVVDYKIARETNNTNKRMDHWISRLPYFVSGTLVTETGKQKGGIE